MLITRYEMTVYADPATNTIDGASVGSLIQDAKAVGILNPYLSFVPSTEMSTFEEGQTWGLRVSFESEAHPRAEGV